MVMVCDISSSSEDNQIKQMVDVLKDRESFPDFGESEKPFRMGFIVKTQKDADRYIKKLKEEFPSVRIVETAPIGSCIAVSFDRGVM